MYGGTLPALFLACQILNNSIYYPQTFKEVRFKMTIQRTLSIIKQDAVKAVNMCNILAMIEKAGFKVIAMKMIHMREETAGGFYAEHKARPFYPELVKFMTSGTSVISVLEKENAVADYRTLMGATNPAQADEGTIRKLYAASIGENAVHGSDSDSSAAREVSYFFAESELLADYCN